MHQGIYDRLKSVAQSGTTITYSEIAPLADLDMSNPAHRNEIRRILGEISAFEHRLNHPLLSAFVVHQEDNMPGKGFFALAKELGVYDGLDDLQFFVTELKKVHDQWRETKA